MTAKDSIMQLGLLDRLQGRENYDTWKIAARASLEWSGFWGYVDGTSRSENCSSMEEYVHKIIMTAHKLKGTGMEVDDEWLGTLLLAGLGEEYKPMIIAMESSAAKISSDLIKTKLLQEIGTGCGEQSNALYTRGNSKRYPKKKFNSNANSKGNSKLCYVCDQPGHFARECKKKHAHTHTNTGGNNGSVLLHNAK